MFLIQQIVELFFNININKKKNIYAEKEKKRKEGRLVDTFLHPLLSTGILCLHSNNVSFILK